MKEFIVICYNLVFSLNNYQKNYHGKLWFCYQENKQIMLVLDFILPFTMI